VQLPENRPAKVVSSHEAIPVIDLGGHDHADITKQILKASEEYGFFQVNVNLTATFFTLSVFVFLSLLIQDYIYNAFLKFLLWNDIVFNLTFSSSSCIGK